MKGSGVAVLAGAVLAPCITLRVQVGGMQWCGGFLSGVAGVVLAGMQRRTCAGRTAT